PLPRALAAPQRQHDAVGRIHAGGQVGDRDTRAGAARARLAGDADHAALGLEYQVERRALAIRSVLAEAGDGRVDDPGIALARCRVVEPELLERADAVVLQHHVALLDQLEK